MNMAGTNELTKTKHQKTKQTTTKKTPGHIWVYE